MVSTSGATDWLETWSSKQFAGVTTTLPPAEPSLDGVDAKARLEHARYQVPDLRTLIRKGRANDYRGKLVNVHMAVIETMDPEYYPGAVQDQTGKWNCCKYGNGGNAVQNGIKQVAYWERMPVAVQSIPGMSEWCTPSGWSVDSVCCMLAQQHIAEMGFPDPNAPNSDSGIVLLYDCAATSVHIHDVIRVIGVLDDVHHVEDDEMTDIRDDFDVLMDAENMADNENAGVVSQPAKGRRMWRVHAMHVETLSNIGSNPYEQLFVKQSMAGEFLRQMRAAAIDWLARPFGGDRLCGELVLLQLLCKNSAVYGGRVTRRMTLNIHGLPGARDQPTGVTSCSDRSWGTMAEAAGPPGTGHPAGTTSLIASSAAEAAASVYPFVNILPVTDAVTAHRSLFPYHDAAANRLRTGLLQLAPHACLVMDECMQELSPASAEHDGLRARNIQSLHTFLASGVLEADYTWQQVQLPVSGSALLLSPQPSAFASTCHVCLSVAGDEVLNDSVGAQSPLQGIRSYLASTWGMWNGLSYGGANAGDLASSEWLQQKLVLRGKAIATVLNGRSSAAADTMRAYEATVVLLHCTAISHGHNCISEDEWQLLEGLVERVEARGCYVSMVTATAPATRITMQQPLAPMDEEVNRVGISQQRQQGLSAGEAMISAMRTNGQMGGSAWDS